MELNDLYDHLWNMGTTLESEDALSVLETDYRPWPRVRYTEGASRHYYDHLWLPWRVLASTGQVLCSTHFFAGTIGTVCSTHGYYRVL